MRASTADGDGEVDRDGSSGEATSKPAAVVVDPSAGRPFLVQLRPSTRVVLDNAPK